MPHALITGGAGFIGSHLAELLLAQGRHVTVVDDESTGALANLAAVRDDRRLTLVLGDVTDAALVRELIESADEVYHLAASVGVQRQWCGRLGKIENCQVGIYLGYVSRHDHALVDVRLFLPKEWARRGFAAPCNVG